LKEGWISLRNKNRCDTKFPEIARAHSIPSTRPNRKVVLVYNINKRKYRGLHCRLSREKIGGEDWSDPVGAVYGFERRLRGHGGRREALIS